MNVNIDINGLTILIISIVIMTAICIITLYYIKRKYDSIDKYAGKSSNTSLSYNELLKQYEEELNSIGISNKQKKKLLKTFIEKHLLSE